MTDRPQSADPRGRGKLAARLDLNDLRIFMVVAAANGYTRGAAVLGVARSSTCRRVQRLEWRLKVRLIERDTHNFALTEIGEQLYQKCTAIFEAVETACGLIGEAREGLPDRHFLVPLVGDGQRPPTADQIRAIIREEMRSVWPLTPGGESAARFI